MQAAFDATSVPVYLAGVPDDIIRKAILAEYKHRGLNPYRLWKLVEGAGVSRATVYAFVNGKTTLTTEHAGKIMEALGLNVCHADTDGKPKPKRKRTES